MNKAKHNGIISLWKFIFAIGIVILHCDIFAPTPKDVVFGNMAIGVEFFLIVSGYLLAKSAKKKENEKLNIVKDTWNFIFNKIRNLYPYVLIGCTLCLITMILFYSKNIYYWINILWGYTLLTMSGLGSTDLNTPIWYISTMLLVMLIVYPLLRKYKEKYSCLIAPIIIIFLSGYIYQNYFYLRSWRVWNGFVYRGMFRAFLSINVGIVIYELCERLKKFDFTFLGRLLLTITEITLLITTILAQHFLEESYNLDFYWLIFLAIAVLIAFSEKTLTYKLCCNKFFYYLEKLSLPIYLNQVASLNLVRELAYFNKYTYYEKIFIVIFLTTIISIITMELVQLWNKYKDKLYGLVKRLIIKTT